MSQRLVAHPTAHENLNPVLQTLTGSVRQEWYGKWVERAKQLATEGVEMLTEKYHLKEDDLLEQDQKGYPQRGYPWKGQIS